MVPVFKYSWIRSKFDIFILDGFSNRIITSFLKLNSHWIFLNSLLKPNMLTYSSRACFVPPWSLPRDVLFLMYFPTPSFKACSDRSLLLGVLWSLVCKGFPFILESCIPLRVSALLLYLILSNWPWPFWRQVLLILICLTHRKCSVFVPS